MWRFLKFDSKNGNELYHLRGAIAEFILSQYTDHTQHSEKYYEKKLLS